MRPTRSLFAALLLTTGLGVVVAAPSLAAAAPPPGPEAADLKAQPAPVVTVPDFDLTGPAPGPDTPDVTVPDLDLVAPLPTPDLPVISIDDVTLLEGTGGPTGFHFTVSVDHAPESDPVQVTATPVAATADTPADWQGIPVDVVIPPGETTQDVVVSVVGDSAIEDDETFVVELGDAVDGVIGDDEGLGTIIDDDGAGPSASDELTTATTSTTSTTSTTTTVPTPSGSRPSGGSPDRTHRALPVTGASIGALGLVGSAFVVTGTALALRAARARRPLS
jgi:hypothetical protein